MRVGWCPPRLSSSAASTAPQPSWPSTTNSGVCRCTRGVCSVPMTSGEITLPATRTMKSSPKPASKMSSGGTRESLQPRIVAYGMLPLGEVRQDLLLHGRETRFAADEALVAGDEARERFLRRVPAAWRGRWPPLLAAGVSEPDAERRVDRNWPLALRAVPDVVSDESPQRIDAAARSSVPRCSDTSSSAKITPKWTPPPKSIPKSVELRSPTMRSTGTKPPE